MSGEEHGMVGFDHVGWLDELGERLCHIDVDATQFGQAVEFVVFGLQLLIDVDVVVADKVLAFEAFDWAVS